VYQTETLLQRLKGIRPAVTAAPASLQVGFFFGIALFVFMFILSGLT
jgi:uncharacterized membrane protein (DUF485 family)